MVDKATHDVLSDWVNDLLPTYTEKLCIKNITALFLLVPSSASTFLGINRITSLAKNKTNKYSSIYNLHNCDLIWSRMRGKDQLQEGYLILSAYLYYTRYHLNVRTYQSIKFCFEVFDKKMYLLRYNQTGSSLFHFLNNPPTVFLYNTFCFLFSIRYSNSKWCI